LNFAFSVLYLYLKELAMTLFSKAPEFFPPSRSGAFTPVFVMAENGSDLSWKVDENRGN
jgi:hypothetical protein